ncbi:MAG: exodeoxyribonuclease V subunit gamma, partial [Oscillospiraceae bacterium]|nr:exodeoxyribonuclease V subunit gamma [Oscillospiraceae bacterium]
MLHCILGGCGTGKSTQLMEKLQKSLSDGKRTIIIVPEQFSFEAEKKLYQVLGARLFNKLRTCSFVTLSRDILQQFGTAQRSGSYASEQEKLLFLYQAVKTCSQRKEFRLMERRAQSSEFISSLYGVITKLRKASVTSEALAAVSLLFPDVLSDKTHDLSCILLEYDRILQENGKHDSLVNLTEAAALAEMQYYFEGADVYLDEFDSFTGDQYQMLNVILKQADSVTAAIRTDHPEQRESGVFVGGNHTFRKLNACADDHHISHDWNYCDTYVRSEYPELIAAGSDTIHQKPDCIPFGQHIRIAEASDPLMEVEYIGAEICRLLQENSSLRCSDIVIAVKKPDVYFPLLERALERFSLPFDMSMPKPVLHSDLIRYFLSLLTLLSEEGWRTNEILRYLKSPLSGYSPDTIAMLEHYCFSWSVDKEDWNHPFWKEDDETLNKRSDSFGGERLEKLRQRFTKDISRLRRQCRNVTVQEICGVLYQHMLSRKDDSREMIAGWNDIRQKQFVMLWNLLMDTLDTLCDCFGNQTLSMKELQQSMLLLLRSSSYSMPPQTLDCIHIVDAQTARLDSPAIVFVPGVQEGEFPGEVNAGGMFSQEELRQLETQNIKLSRLLPELHSDELLIVRKTLASPKEKLYLTYSLTTDSHEPAAPAGIILEIMGLFPKHPEILLHTSELPVSFYVRTLASGYFHYVRHLQEDCSELSALRSILVQDPVYHARIAKLDHAAFSPDMAVHADVMKPLLGDRIVVSPSGIECFYNCAFQYFCQNVLRLYIPERNSLNPRTGGSFAHFCLEQLLSKLDMAQFLAMSREQLRQEIEQLSGEFSEKHFSDAVRR